MQSISIHLNVYYNELNQGENMNINDYSNIMDELNMMVAIFSKEEKLVNANKVLLSFADVKLDEIQGLYVDELPWIDRSSSILEKTKLAMDQASEGKTARFNSSCLNAQGEVNDVDFIMKPILENNEIKYFLLMAYNITELVKAKKALTNRDRRIKAFFDYSSEGYFFLSLKEHVKRSVEFDNSVVLEALQLDEVNKRMASIVGEKVEDVKQLFTLIDSDDHIKDRLDTIIREGSYTYEETLNFDGMIKHIEVMIVAIYDGEWFEGCFGIIRDITEQINYIEQVTFFANKDPLTGINNRRSFFAEGQQVFDLHNTINEPVTVVMFDIDHFKKVNDTYGHDAGDVVIRDMARYVEDHLPDGCVFGRYGGEEFIVIAPYDLDKTFELFEDIRKRIEVYPFNHDVQPITVTISTGIYAVEDDTLHNSISKADKALYESKQNGRNQTTVFIESIHGEASIDPITGIYTNQTMRYKLNKTIHDVQVMGDSLWLIYFRINVIKEDRLLTEQRHYKTMALSLKSSVRNTDYVGRIGKHGFLAVLRNVNAKQVDDKHERMIDYFEIGFSGMINNVVHLKSTILNGTQMTDVDNMLKELHQNLQNLY